MDGISRFADGVQKFVWKNTSENCWTGWRCFHSHTGLDRIKELQGYVHERTKCGSKLFRGVLIWSDHGICTLDFLGKVCGDLLWGREDMVNKSKEIIMGMVGWYWRKLDMLVNWICEASKDSTVAQICGNVSGFVVSCCLVLVMVDAVGRRKLWRMIGNFW